MSNNKSKFELKLESFDTAKLIKWLGWIFIIALMILSFVFLIYFSVFDGDYSLKQEVWGQFGDFIGGTLNPIFSRSGYSIYEIREGYKKGINSAIVKLTSIKEILEEKLKDISDSSNEIRDFWMDIHPKITSISKSRFETNHYADAVESALKEINSCVKDIVRRKTGKELDGSSLMKTAFSPTNPIIVLDDLSTESGKNIQQGYMEIFAGAMTGIRNPKAHNNINITENRAKHFIYLASLLMFKIDERI